jgi:hypothetical protein
MSRAPSAGIRLSNRDAAIVKGMLHRGDRQHDIAAFFGVNGGRIAEISTGDRFGSIVEAPQNELPAPGPYNYGALNREMREELEKLRVQSENLAKTISNALTKL